MTGHGGSEDRTGSPSALAARVLVFAKAPIAGEVKTRLIPALGARGAAELQGRLLRELLGRLFAGGPAMAVELWCAPDPSHGLFGELARRYPLSLRRQRGRGLGERLLNAALESGRGGAPVILIGADCPLLDRGYLERARDLLAAGQDAVLGPAEDGGYVLLGLRRTEPALFREMPWGGAQVAELTRARMQRLGWRWSELPSLWDLDRPEDLLRLADLRLR